MKEPRAYAAFTKGRTTPIVVSATDARAAKRAAKRSGKADAANVTTARLLTADELAKAADGKWIRARNPAEAPGKRSKVRPHLAARAKV